MTKINVTLEFQRFIKEFKRLFVIQIPEVFIIFKNNRKLFKWFMIVLVINSLSDIGLITYKPFNAVMGIIFKFIIQAFLVLVFCSDFIERILRKCESVRRVATKTEKERLYPLFQEVYDKALQENSLIGKRIKLYMVDSMEVNAFIISRNTLAVTRGALKMLNDDELKAIMAHEFGHLNKCDGVITILIDFCSTIYLWFFMALSFLFTYLEKESNGSLLADIFGIINQLIQLPVKIIYLVSQLIISGGSRKAEYRADTYACKLGYQEQLKSALYKLYNMQISDRKKGLIENLQRTHPVLAYRIERLEDIVTTE